MGRIKAGDLRQVITLKKPVTVTGQSMGRRPQLSEAVPAFLRK